MLVSALDDTDRRHGLKWDFNEVSTDNPRICDVAALVLSTRWPEKYRFQWVKNPTEADAQIAKIRGKWRAENGVAPEPK
jgi:hypothetical protein